MRYLEASGAAAISIVDADGAAISVGIKRDVAAYWLPVDQAIAVARRARNIAGADPDVDGAVAALQESAAHYRVTLTEHFVALARAGEAARRTRCLL